MNQPVLPGPDLPTKYFRHCITKINEDIVALVGGYNTETTTLLVDVSHGWWQGRVSQAKHHDIIQMLKLNYMKSRTSPFFAWLILAANCDLKISI